MNRSRRLHVIGAGGHAKVVVALAEALGWTIAGIFDDRPGPLPSVLGHDVVGSTRDMPDTPETLAVIAIGGNSVRSKLAQQFQDVTWARLIHPSAWVAPSSEILPGAVVMAGVIVQPDVMVGSHTIINTAASIDHDCQIGDFVHIAPGSHLAGNVTVNQGAFLGVGTCCIPGVTVGSWATVGAGSVVLKDLPDQVTAIGVPARIIE